MSPGLDIGWKSHIFLKVLKLPINPYIFVGPIGLKKPLLILRSFEFNIIMNRELASKILLGPSCTIAKINRYVFFIFSNK